MFLLLSVHDVDATRLFSFIVVPTTRLVSAQKSATSRQDVHLQRSSIIATCRVSRSSLCALMFSYSLADLFAADADIADILKRRAMSAYAMMRHKAPPFTAAFCAPIGPGRQPRAVAGGAAFMKPALPRAAPRQQPSGFRAMNTPAHHAIDCLSAQDGHFHIT